MSAAKAHVLFIAYYYPPSVEAGAKRALGLHRYLADWGYRSTLVTVGPATTDPAQEGDVVRVGSAGYRRGLARVASGTRGPLLSRLIRLYKEVVDIPDGYGAFFASALAAGIQVHQQRAVDAIVATSPPHTSLRIGAALSRQLGVPWIADLRDLWTQNHFGYRHSRARLLIDSFLERRWLKTAGRIVTATQGLSHQLLDQGFSSTTIYNGFLEQPAYFPPEAGTFRIKFLGHLYNGLGYTPEAVFQALTQLRRNAAPLFQSLHVEFTGTVNEEFWELRDRLELETTVHYAGQVSAARAMEQAQAADLLLVFIPDKPTLSGVVPTKLFDYAATRRPILFVGPDGEAAKFVRDRGLGRAFRSSESDGISLWIQELAREKHNGQSVAWGDPEEISRLHYRWRARDLALQIDETLGERSGPFPPVRRHSSGPDSSAKARA